MSEIYCDKLEKEENPKNKNKIINEKFLDWVPPSILECFALSVLAPFSTLDRGNRFGLKTKFPDLSVIECYIDRSLFVTGC